MKKLKWTRDSIAAYKSAEEDLRGRGYRAMREIQDLDCSTVLTFWAGSGPTYVWTVHDLTRCLRKHGWIIGN